ncbi:MAG: hypothetical protein Q9192_008493, partial [Flavoplaca navasiana]
YEDWFVRMRWNGEEGGKTYDGENDGEVVPSEGVDYPYSGGDAQGEDKEDDGEEDGGEDNDGRAPVALGAHG